jgi:formate C-acetyltransferase
MTDRIKNLREQSLHAVPSISAERALLVTEFYQSEAVRNLSAPVVRALAFEYILEHKQICINEEELIVGERGPAPKACPTYPEICIHSPDDLDILNSRKKVSFRVDEETKKNYTDRIVPFWKGRSTRDRIMQTMEPEWLNAFQAGVFTEFLEQRAPGHTVAGTRVFEQGMLDFIRELEVCRSKRPDTGSDSGNAIIEEWKAMEIVAKAMIRFAERHAESLEFMASKERGNHQPRQSDFLEMARICRKVPAHAPETFHEALQHYWFIHLGVITELNPWDSFNPGRLDQNLWPFYKQETEAGTLTRERAVELLQSFWIKFNNHPAPPKVGVTAQESNTYTDFCLINLGGLKPDGTDAVNELTFLILDVIEEMRLVQPSSMIQMSHKNPDSLIHRALRIIKTGFGQPSCFNTDAIIRELTFQGKSLQDALNGGASGCVETGAFGTEAYILSGYFNLPKILEMTLNNGYDPRMQKQIGILSGDPVSFRSFDELLDAFRAQVNWFVQVKIRGNNAIHRIFSESMPVPFLSLLIDDCISNGKDYNAGGARYNTTYIQGVGLGSVADSLTALRFHVYDRKTIGMTGFLDSLQKDFRDYDEFRAELIFNTPKWGNDDDYADAQAREVFEIFFSAADGIPTAAGGVHRINLLPTTSHIYFGGVTGALPDGRKSGQPLSEGISPVQGADTRGPTAVLNSAAKIDHLRTGGTLLNQKFSPGFFTGETAIKQLTALIRSYFRMNGHHIQFNVVTAATLRDAQKHPEKYRDLIVRVAGYSDYFNDLGEVLQNEIIQRTEHE